MCVITITLVFKDKGRTVIQLFILIIILDVFKSLYIGQIQISTSYCFLDLVTLIKYILEQVVKNRLDQKIH